MTADNEREIRESLDGALGTLTPARPPVESVIRQGKGIRMRRRAGVAVGLAVIAAAAVALPGLLRQAAHPPEPAQHGYHVTVSPPPPGAPAGEIATGTIDGKPWTVIYNIDHGKITAHGPRGMYIEPDPSPEGSPANFESESGTWRVLSGSVRRDVTRLAVTVQGGPVLNLRPVSWRGHRWAAIVLPARMRILRVTAYSRHGELGYAIPFGNHVVIAWLKPGQRGFSRQSATIGSGVVQGTHWTSRGYLGPWGLCLNSGDNGECTADPATLLGKNRLVSQRGCGGGVREATFSLDVAALQVRTVRLQMSDGSTLVVHPAELGPVRAFVFAVGRGLRLARWTAYDSAGQQLGTGTSTGWVCKG